MALLPSTRAVEGARSDRRADYCKKDWGDTVLAPTLPFEVLYTRWLEVVSEFSNTLIVVVSYQGLEACGDGGFTVR